jgi:biopolymer transport protein ExbD
MPSSRAKKRTPPKLNLNSVLDGVFIIIFFLLMSVNFIHIYEINSDVPILSSAPPPKDEKIPLSLTLKIEESGITILTGAQPQVYKKITVTEDGNHDLILLHDALVEIKKKHPLEETAILEPIQDLTYEELVKIIDSVILLKETDDMITTKNSDGLEVTVKKLFPQIIFSNTMS